MRLIREHDKKSPDNHRLADGSLDVARVRSDFADGYTIVLDDVEQYVRSIASLAHAIEVELNFATKVNAYVTPPESQGSVAHYDGHDVLILQIQGSKIWHLYEGADVPPHQLRREEKWIAADSLSSPIDLRMEVGDVLYVPRGRVHAAEATSEPSVHLTVGIHAPTALTFAVAALNALSFFDDRLSVRLPPRHLDDADARATLGVLLRDAVRTVEGRSARRSLATRRPAFRAGGRCCGDRTHDRGIPVLLQGSRIPNLYRRCGTPLSALPSRATARLRHMHRGDVLKLVGILIGRS